MPYHPSQQILPEHEALYSKAIIESLINYPVMVGELAGSSCFPHHALTPPLSTAPLKFNQKLGHLYEEALAALLSQSSRYALSATNLQLITPEKRTIGELDFILKDHESDAWIHLELAVKFYLIYQHYQQTTYPGPDARDNYQRKLERLTNHQLTLTQRPDFSQLLPQFQSGDRFKIQHLVPGIFFDHIYSEQAKLPEQTSASVRRRKWLYCNEFTSTAAQLQSVRVIPKQLWLCEINDEIFDSLVAVPIKELLEIAQLRCTMCVNKAGGAPYFLVPDTWPGQQK